METPIKIHDLGVPLFLETPIYVNYEGYMIYVKYLLVIYRSTRPMGKPSTGCDCVSNNEVITGDFGSTFHGLPRIERSLESLWEDGFWSNDFHDRKHDRVFSPPNGGGEK